MEAAVITAVGIDVSKSKSTVAVRRPGGEIVLRPFDVRHTNSDLKKLTSTLKKLGGDIRIVMEHTSTYWRPIALTLKEAGFFVSVVNAMLIHDFSDNTIRKLKTDRADALKSQTMRLPFGIYCPRSIMKKKPGCFLKCNPEQMSESLRLQQRCGTV